MVMALIRLTCTVPTLAQDTATTTQVPSPSAVPTILVEGQVTDYIGSGVKDVVITAYFQNDDKSKGELIAETKTDGIGDFALTTAKAIQGDIIVIVSKNTFQTNTHHLHIGDDELPLFIAETLQGTLQIKGSLRSIENDQPIKGANISLSTGYQDFNATSDDLGKFLLKNLSPGSAHLTITAQGFGRERIRMQNIKDESEDDIAIVLKPERVINLIVRNELNEPVSGVTVELYDRPRDDLQTIVTNSEGKAIVSGIHFDADLLHVRLTHEDYVSSIDYDQTITLSKQEIVSHHELNLKRGGKISGIVLDEQGQPLNGARIVAGDKYTDASPRDWSTFNGSFTIHQVPPGQALVTVHLSDYAPQLKRVEVAPAKTTRVEFRLKPGVSLSGFVRTEDGEAVKGAEIIATKWHDAQTLGLRAMTNAQGRFDMRDAPLDEFEIQAITPAGHKKTLTVSVKPNDPILIIVPTEPPTPRSGKGPAIGDEVPAITLTTLTGQVLDLKALKGKTILIDFWATWCGPCVAELPKLEDLYKEYHKRDDFIMIGVSQDFDLSTLKRFIKKRKKMAWPQVYNDATSDNSPANVFGIELLPTIYIIGADGKIASKGLRGSAIGKKVRAMLKDQSLP